MGNTFSEEVASAPLIVLGGTVLEYISTWYPQQVQKLRNTFAEWAQKTTNWEDIKEIKNNFQALVSLGQELDLCFKIPNQQILSNMTPPPSPNQVVGGFINFLLHMIEAITYCESISPHEEKYSIENVSKDLKFVIQNLQTELEFLITFVDDTAMHLQPTLSNNIMMDIEAVVNEVGSFIFSYTCTLGLHLVIPDVEPFCSPRMDIEAARKEVGKFLCSSLNEDMPLQTTEMEEMENEMAAIKDLACKVQTFTHFFVPIENDQFQEVGILDLALCKLFPQFELLNPKIKEYCIDVSKREKRTLATTSTHLVSCFTVDSILDDLMYLINNKSHIIAGVNDQISKLHEELMLLGSFVNEIAEQQQVEHEQLIIQTRDLAYEVEYVINSFPPIWYLTIRLPQLIEKIQLITTAVKEVKCGHIETAKSPNEQSSLPSGYSPDLECDVVGFKELEMEIAEQLLGGTERLQIISIYGMPGIGKTTLANKLYNHPSVVNRFDCRACCVSSQTHNKRNMLISILMSLGHLKKEVTEDEKKDEEDDNNIEDEDLGGKVYRFIKRRRYLLVIDDIWDIDAWNDLKRYFPDDGIGSKILFTTRNKEVGLEASASIVKELPFLSDAECWELLERGVFKDENCPEELLDIGKNIAIKCQGLPLAVVLIAGVLANVEKEEHLWQKVESSISSCIAGSQEKCMQLLELSYKKLPVHLKPCFLYFGAFKEDEEIPVQILTSIWIAERFIKNEDGKSLEDVALEYLMKLIDRSLVIVSKRRSNGKVKACKIHDLVLEMCLRIADENCFVKKVESGDHDRILYQRHRCLRFVCDLNKSSNYIPPFGLHMRSLLCTDADMPMLFSSSFKVLKVFHFHAELNYFLMGLEHLVHLRYLAIKSKMPAIENLHKLEFLDVENDRYIEITEVLLNMVNLRRMHFKGGAFFSESCRQQATNEESFQINNKVIQSIAKVQIFDKIDEKIMRCFPNLRKLEAKLQGSFNCSFAFLNQLESLKLTVKSRFRFINLPSNLKQLTLVKGQISPKQTEIISRLEYLEVLKLEYVEFEGDQWDTSEVEFAQLRVLKLKRVDISEWNASMDNFPSLQKLILEYCSHFKIPSDFGDIPTLERIEVFGCRKSVVESAKKIEKEQEDAGNEILTIMIHDTWFRQ